MGAYREEHTLHRELKATSKEYKSHGPVSTAIELRIIPFNFDVSENCLV